MAQVLGIQIINASTSGISLLSNDLASDEHINIYRVGDKTALTPVSEETVNKITSFSEQLGVEETLLTFVGVDTETGDFDEDFAKPYLAKMKEKYDLKTSAMTLNDVDDLVELIEEITAKPAETDEAKVETAETDTENTDTDDVSLDELGGDFNTDEKPADVSVETKTSDVVAEAEPEKVADTEDVSQPEPETAQAEELTVYQKMAIKAVEDGKIEQFDVDVSEDTLSVLPEITNLRQVVDQSLAKLINDIASSYEQAEAQARENAEDATLKQARSVHDEKVVEIRSNQTPMETQALRELETQRNNAREAYVAEHIDDLRRKFDEETKDEYDGKRDEVISDVREKVSSAVDVENQAFEDFVENKVEPLIAEERESVDVQSLIDSYNSVVVDAKAKIDERKQEIAKAHQDKINTDNAEIELLKRQVADLQHTNELLKKNIDIHIDSKLEEERLDFNTKMNANEVTISKLQEENDRLKDNNRHLTSDLNAIERWGGVRKTEDTVKKA